MALRRLEPRASAGRLYREAFTVGRDHLSATGRHSQHSSGARVRHKLSPASFNLSGTD